MLGWGGHSLRLLNSTCTWLPLSLAHQHTSKPIKKQGTAIIPALHKGKLRHRVMKRLTQDCPADGTEPRHPAVQPTARGMRPVSLNSTRTPSLSPTLTDTSPNAVQSLHCAIDALHFRNNRFASVPTSLFGKGILGKVCICVRVHETGKCVCACKWESKLIDSPLSGNSTLGTRGFCCIPSSSGRAGGDWVSLGYKTGLASVTQQIVLL